MRTKHKQLFAVTSGCAAYFRSPRPVSAICQRRRWPRHCRSVLRAHGKGVLVMMWYGFRSDDEAAALMKEIRVVCTARRCAPPITGSGVVGLCSQLCIIPISTSTQALWAAAFFAATSPRISSCLARS